MSGSHSKLILKKEFDSAIRFAEYLKRILLHYELVPVVILLNEHMHFDVFVENIGDVVDSMSLAIAEVYKRYHNPSVSIYEYENYEHVIEIMCKNKTDVFWECMNNWRVK